jgi:hypothetical protein
VVAPLTPEEEALVNGYWGVAPTADGGGAAPFQPNPGAPGYNPNPGAAPAPARAVLGNTPPIPVEQQGAIGRAFSGQSHGPPLFQNPFAKPQTPVDLGEIDQPEPVNLGDVDAPGFVPPAARSAPAMGPTPQEDADLAAFNAKLTASKPAPTGGGGGTRPAANPDPYGIRAATRQAVGSFDDQEGAQRRMGAAQAYGAQLQADHHAELSRRQEEDAAIARAEEDYAAQETEKSFSEIARQLDDVRAKKIQPINFMDQGPATGILAVIASAMGGFYQGITGARENPVTADLDRFIERQVAIDERNLDNEKAGLGQKLNLLGQQRQVHRDRQTANAATRMLVYEAAREQLAADAANADVPWKKAAADAAIAELQRNQAMLLKQFGEAAQQRDRAAAAAAMARDKEVISTYRDTYDKALSAGYTPAQAEFEAKRMIGNLYAPGSQGARPPEEPGAALGKEGRQKLAFMQHEAQGASDEFNSQVDSLKKHPALDGLGITTGPAASVGGQRLAPGSSAVIQDLNQINTQIINAIGKVARDAEGKPNVLMMERYEHRFSIEPNDTKEIAIQKLEGARNVVNSLARQHGAGNAPKPSARQDEDAALGAKPLRR